MVRRRNGKRGKGMATKKEKTKEQRIKTEKTRLKGIFKDLDENKRKLVTPLIEKAAFMSVELDDLQAKLEKDGWTSEYQNGQNQWGTKKSPEAETYIALSKNYAAYGISTSCETKDKQAGGFAGRVSNIAALSKLYL